jgi:hypothetical protein
MGRRGALRASPTTGRRRRANSKGQTRSTLYVYLVAAGTVDSTIITALRNREEGISAVLAAAKAAGTLADPDAE